MPITSWTPERVIAPCEAAFKPAAEGLVKVAQGLVPRRTGRLAASVHMTFTGATSGALSASAPYAAAVTKGTRAHTETSGTPMPIGNGRYAYVVHHPATRAQPFLNEAAASFQPLYVNTARGMMHLGF